MLPSVSSSTLLSLALCVAASAPVVAEPERLSLQVGDVPVRAEYAASDAARQRGLMQRERLPDGEGMLLHFPASARQCLWMKNTPLPLSAAFIDEHGRIVDLIDLEPLSLEIRCSTEPARYALEVPQGWFERNGVNPGAEVTGLPD